MRLSYIPNHLLPVLNGLVGNTLIQKKPDWSIQMSFRIGKKNVLVSTLKQKQVGKNVLVLVHGLMAEEQVWNKIGIPLEKDCSVLYVRYNTGLHISENGQKLAMLLHELQLRFNVKKLFLVGHSMGGLVLRSACHYAKQTNLRWVKRVSTVFLLAVPNAGASLEKLGHGTSFTLKFLGRWYLGHLGILLDQRSDGIKDLRLGSMLEEDWKPPKEKLLDHFNRSPVPPIPGIQYHILVGSLSKNEKSLMAKYFGDGLVTQGSAVGKTLLKQAHVKIFPKTGHNSLLRDKRVCRYIKDVLKYYL